MPDEPDGDVAFCGCSECGATGTLRVGTAHAGCGGRFEPLAGKFGDRGRRDAFEEERIRRAGEERVASSSLGERVGGVFLRGKDACRHARTRPVRFGHEEMENYTLECLDCGASFDIFTSRWLPRLPQEGKRDVIKGGAGTGGQAIYAKRARGGQFSDVQQQSRTARAEAHSPSLPGVTSVKPGYGYKGDIPRGKSIGPGEPPEGLYEERDRGKISAEDGIRKANEITASLQQLKLELESDLGPNLHKFQAELDEAFQAVYGLVTAAKTNAVHHGKRDVIGSGEHGAIYAKRTRYGQFSDIQRQDRTARAEAHSPSLPGVTSVETGYGYQGDVDRGKRDVIRGGPGTGGQSIYAKRTASGQFSDVQQQSRTARAEAHSPRLPGVTAVKTGYGYTGDVPRGKAPKAPEASENFWRVRFKTPSSFDDGSFRTAKNFKRKGVNAVFACPTGQYDAKKKRCKVGMELQALMFRKDQFTKAKARSRAEKFAGKYDVGEFEFENENEPDAERAPRKRRKKHPKE